MELKFAYTETESIVRDALVKAIDKCFSDEKDWWQTKLIPSLTKDYELEKVPLEKDISQMELNYAYKLLTYREDGKFNNMYKFVNYYHLDFTKFKYLLTETKLIRNFISHRSKKDETDMDVETVKFELFNCKKLIEPFDKEGAGRLTDIINKINRQKKSVEDVAAIFGIEISDVMTIAYKLNLEFSDGHIMVDEDFDKKMLQAVRTLPQKPEEPTPQKETTKEQTPQAPTPQKPKTEQVVVVEPKPETVALTTPETNRFFNLVLSRPVFFLSDCLLKEESMNFFNRTVIPALLRAKAKERRIFIMDSTLSSVLRHKSDKSLKAKELSNKAYEIIKYLVKNDLTEILDGDNVSPFEQEMLILKLTENKEHINKPVVFTENSLVANEISKLYDGKSNTYTYDNADKLIEVKLEEENEQEEKVIKRPPSPSQPENKEEKEPEKQNNAKKEFSVTPKPNENGLFKYKTTVSGVDRSVIKTSVIPYEDDTVISQKYGKIVLVEEFAGGGEGLLYKTDKKGIVAKVYKEDRITRDRLEKLKLMISQEIQAPHVCWPLDIITNRNGEFVGYVMKEGKGRKLYNLLINPKNIEKYFSGWDRRNLVKLSITILEAFKSIHKHNILAGDVNLYNILVESDESVYFVDCDSYQIDKFQSTVGIEGFIAPEIYEYMDKVNGGNLDLEKTMRTFESESFAIASLIFHVLFLGQSPYASVGNESIAKSIKGRQFAYPFGERNGYLSPAGYWRFIWSHLTFQVKEMFDAIFVKDKRFSEDYMIDKLKGYLHDMEKREHISKELIPTKYKETNNTEFVSLKCSMCGSEFNTDKDSYEKKTDLEKSQLLCQTCIRAVSTLKKTPEIYSCPTCRKKVTTTKWDYARMVDHHGIPRRCDFCRNMTYRQIQDYLYPPRPKTTTTTRTSTASTTSRTTYTPPKSNPVPPKQTFNRTTTPPPQNYAQQPQKKAAPKFKVPAFISNLYARWQKNVFKNTLLILFALMSYLYIKEYGLPQYIHALKEIVTVILNILKFIVVKLVVLLKEIIIWIIKFIEIIKES